MPPLGTAIDRLRHQYRPDVEPGINLAPGVHAEEGPEVRPESQQEQKATNREEAVAPEPGHDPGSDSSDSDDDRDDKNPEENKEDDQIKISEKDAKHIFRDKEGHFKSDTPENRKIIEDMVNNRNNRLGHASKYEKDVYAKITSEGKQIWAEVRNGQIRHAGINEVPKTFNSITGLSRLTPPK